MGFGPCVRQHSLLGRLMESHDHFGAMFDHNYYNVVRRRNVAVACSHYRLQNLVKS